MADSQTQQPSYHVTAASYHRDGIPQHPYEESQQSLPPSASSQLWTQEQLLLNTQAQRGSRWHLQAANRSESSRANEDVDVNEDEDIRSPPLDPYALFDKSSSDNGQQASTAHQLDPTPGASPRNKLDPAVDQDSSGPRHGDSSDIQAVSKDVDPEAPNGGEKLVEGAERGTALSNGAPMQSDVRQAVPAFDRDGGEKEIESTQDLVEHSIDLDEGDRLTSPSQSQTHNNQFRFPNYTKDVSASLSSPTSDAGPSHLPSARTPSKRSQATASRKTPQSERRPISALPLPKLRASNSTPGITRGPPSATPTPMKRKHQAHAIPVQSPSASEGEEDSFEERPIARAVKMRPLDKLGQILEGGIPPLPPRKFTRTSSRQSDRSRTSTNDTRNRNEDLDLGLKRQPSPRLPPIGVQYTPVPEAAIESPKGGADEAKDEDWPSQVSLVENINGAQATSQITEDARGLASPESMAKTDDETGPVQGQGRPGFGRYASIDNAMDDQSDLFQSSLDHLGEKDEEVEFTFQATQAASVPQRRESSPIRPATIASLSPTALPSSASNQMDVDGGGSEGLQLNHLAPLSPPPEPQANSSHSRSTIVPEHRMLRPTNKPTTIHSRARAGQTLTRQVPRTAPLPSRQIYEPTQIDEPAAVTLPTRLDTEQATLVETFVNDAAPSPPPERVPSQIQQTSPLTTPPPASDTRNDPYPSSPPPSLPIERQDPSQVPTELPPTLNSSPPTPTNRSIPTPVPAAPRPPPHLDRTPNATAGPSTVRRAPPPSHTGTSGQLTTPTENKKGKRKARKSAKLREAEADAGTDLSSDSGDTVEDLEDYSFRPVAKKAKSTSAVPRPPKSRSKSASRKSEASKPAEDGSNSDSSDAPEDPEDNTYRPVQNGVHKQLTSVTAKGSGRSTRASSTSSTSKGKVTPKAIKQKKSDPSAFTIAKASNTEAGPSTARQEVPAAADASTKQPERLYVLGYWPPLHSYFVGTVGDRVGSKFMVNFVDGHHKLLALDQMRLFELRKGDAVFSNGDLRHEVNMQAVEAWHCDTRGVQVTIGDEIAGHIPLAALWIKKKTIEEHFDTRRVLPKHLGLSAAEFEPQDDTSNAKVSRESLCLAGKSFLITNGSSSGNTSVNIQSEMGSMVKKYGGRVVDDWPKLFDRPADGFGSKLKGNEASFVIVHGGESQKPKVLAALAAGIPCLVSDYIDDIGRRDVDWRSYLISAGVSLQSKYHLSQLVDPNWGGEKWTASKARSIRQPFSGKSFLFLKPPDRDIGSLVRDLVPFCLHAMGAASLDQVNSASAVKSLDGYDYILIEDRMSARPNPSAWEETGKLCNFLWLKQCIASRSHLSGAALDPAVLKEESTGPK